MNGTPGPENSFQSLLYSPLMAMRFFSRSSNARGFILPAGWLPALKALNLSFPRALRIASAIMLRAELVGASIAAHCIGLVECGNFRRCHLLAQLSQLSL